LREETELRIEWRKGGRVVISELNEGRPGVPAGNAHKPIVGLVGGMGSGKSRVAEAFARQGAAVVAGDPLGHEALERPEILERIAARWGERVLGEGGVVDRKKLGAIVFASPVERANLEHLVFPWIEARIREEIAKAQADPRVPFVVLDAAIMLEAGWNNVCDRIVYVHAPREERLARLTAQRGWNADEVARRETAQLPLSVKASRADAAVDNSGGPDAMQAQVDDLLRRWHWKS
jgi:dephospho-CoA kinase